MTPTKIKTINSHISQFDTWNQKFSQAVLQSNKLAYEEISGLKLSTAEVVSCAELAYTVNPCKENYAYFISPTEANFKKHLTATKKFNKAVAKGLAL